MNSIIIIISILLTVILILVSLLQLYQLNIHIKLFMKRRPPNENRPSIIFEDLIPSGKYEIDLPLKKFNVDNKHNDDVVLSSLTSFLYHQPKKFSENYCFLPKDHRLYGTTNEIHNILQAANTYKLSGNTKRAKKLFNHAAAIAPHNPDVLNKYGEYLEEADQDYLTAAEMYYKALTYSPEHSAALENYRRSAQVVEGLDHELFKYIDFKTDKLKNQIKLDTFETMKKQAYYLHIYHTIAIEGNTMTVKQLRYLLETGNVVPGKSIVEHNEVLGLEKALQFIKSIIHHNFITVNDILNIHRRVMGHVDPIESGAFRKENVFVGGHIPPPHQDIPTLMDSYIEWLNSDEAQSMHPVRYAALAHYKLVDIHPFVDGNGRTSRLIMNLILLKYGYPPVMILKEQRERYYEALKIANMGDVRPFVRFIAQCTLQVLDMYITNTMYLSVDGDSDYENSIIHF